MKFKAFFAVTFSAATVAMAGSFTFSPDVSDLNDLDHYNAYEWGIKWAVPNNESITGATLTFKNIWDWTVEPDTLWVRLLDTPSFGSIPTGSAGKVRSYWDDQGNTDYFAGRSPSVSIGTWSDPLGGAARNFDLIFNLGSLGYIDELTSYIGNNGKFAIAIDPDCHYFNDGVTLTITTSPTVNPPPSVPDGGATMLLLGGAVTVLVGLRRRQNR